MQPRIKGHFGCSAANQGEDAVGPMTMDDDYLLLSSANVNNLARDESE